MLGESLAGIRDVIGSGNGDLSVGQMALRAFIIYVTAILLVRVGNKRFMGKNTAFDVILGIVLGSVLSRAITGNAPFLQTIGAGAALVGLHWFFSVASFHSDRIGTFIKGQDRTLVKDGEIQWDNMRKSYISRNDLDMALRSTGKVTDPVDVAMANLERSGDISVIPREKQKKLKVVEISVHDGVQKVRIELAEAD